MSEKIPFTFLDKPSIPMDERLHQLGDSFVNFIEEVESLAPEELENCLFVGSMEKTDPLIPKVNFLRFIWAYSTGSKNSISLASLQNMKFENNLDTLLDYKDGFSAPIYFVFPLVECIRMNYNSDKVYLVGDETKCEIYIKN
ncbi:MAG: hypothetical protein H7A25_09835 [Leptospiraceae bacterium]|nr:hypothetical protein [Leptospiraceae bacterium]MCP5500190.1 hypothetical protein [Leptospiraceae bacterium]